MRCDLRSKRPRIVTRSSHSKLSPLLSVTAVKASRVLSGQWAVSNYDCGRRHTAPARRSAPVERLRKLEHTLGRRVPAFRRMRTDLEGVALPGAVDRVRTLVRIDARGLPVLSDRVAPFAEPPVGLLALVRGVSMRRGVVVAGDIVDLLAAIFFQHRILTHDLAPLLVLGRIPEARIVAEIERDIPVEGQPAEGAALLRLAKRRRQRLGAHRRRPESDQAVLNAFARGLVGSDMLIADDPQIETLRLLMPYRRSRLRDRGGDRGRERGGARLEQSPSRG